MKATRQIVDPVVYSLRVERDLYDRLTAIAASQHRQLAQQLRVILEDAVDRAEQSEAEVA